MNLSIGVKQFMFSQQNQLHGQPMAFNHMRYQHGHIGGLRILILNSKNQNLSLAVWSQSLIRESFY